MCEFGLHWRGRGGHFVLSLASCKAFTGVPFSGAKSSHGMGNKAVQGGTSRVNPYELRTKIVKCRCIDFFSVCPCLLSKECKTKHEMTITKPLHPKATQAYPLPPAKRFPSSSIIPKLGTSSSTLHSSHRRSIMWHVYRCLWIDRSDAAQTMRVDKWPGKAVKPQPSSALTTPKPEEPQPGVFKA